MSARVPIGIVMNGVTGRMGYRQHLVRSLLAIRESGGLPLRDGSVLWPELLLVGRSEAKLRDVATRHGLTEWTTDLGAALARPDMRIYFDAQVTSEREKAIGLAIEAGKHIYTEKPLATTLHGAIELARSAASTSSWPSATDSAIGFSVKTCLPAPIALRMAFFRSVVTWASK